MESSWPGPRPASGGELAAEPGVGPPSVGNDEVSPRVGPDAGGAAGNDRVVDNVAVFQRWRIKRCEVWGQSNLQVILNFKITY